ncbi:MAG: hypothetical protein IKV16_04725 [Clostridia bacterium]|nr:hypothetical protein [Clostridia bacterium]
MRKFAKVLTLLLSVVLLVAAFCVVAMASDTDEGAALEKKQALLKYYDYETGTIGSTSWNANVDGTGTFEVAAAENGNKYIKHSVTTAAVSGANAGYLSGPYQANKTYSIAEYPYLSIDFDICKIAGDYAGAGVNPYYYGNGAVYDDFGNLSTTLNQETGGNITVKIATIKKYLPTEYMTWAHITMVFKYHIQDDAQYIGAYVYVDGKLVYFSDTLHELNSQRLASNYYFGTFRINNDGTAVKNPTDFSGYDNWQFNFFNDAYSMDEVASYVYNDSYELPYGVTIANVGNRVYDRMSTAIAEAKPGEVIKLVSDINGLVNVDNTVTIDTNKYDENGNPTGEYYNITTTSTSLVSETKDGIISFKKVQNASVQIYWDDCPGKAAGKACTCDPIYLDENGNHVMEAFTATAMLNSVPTYPGTIPTFPIINGLAQNFIGWSYTPGGPVEDIKAIGPDDVEDGWIAFYPVYEQIKYSFEVLAADGSSQAFYLEDEYDLAIASVAKNGTLKFHTDIAAASFVTLTTRYITIDLNGYAFTSAPIVNTYRGQQNGSGEWVAVGDPISTTGTSGYIGFSIDGKGELTLKSSRPGASIYNAKPTVTLIVDGAGNVVDQSVSLKKDMTFISYKGSKPHVVNVLGDVSIYTYSQLVYNDWNSNTNGATLNMDGASIYCLGNATLLRYNEGSVHNYTNTKFYFMQGSLVSNYTSAASELARDIKTTVTLNNCDIYTYENKGGAPSFSYSVDKDSFNVYNSRIFTASYDKDRAHFGDGTYLIATSGNVMDGCVREAFTETFTYYPVSSIEFDWDSSSSRLVYLPQRFESVKTTSYYVYNPDFGPTTVTFKDLDGNVISTVTAKKNNPIATPIVALGDGYRNLLNPIWRDANGNLLGETLGDADEYVFTAELPDEAVRKYSANLTVAMMNMSYYSQFAYNLYVPKTDAVEIISIAGATELNVVLINNAEYYVFTVSVDVLDAFDVWTAKVVYAIDGDTFEAELALSAYVYAMASVAADDHTAADKAASGALIKLIEEAIKYELGAVDADTQALLDSFYAVYAPAPYATEYPAGELCEINVESVAGVIESLGFRVLAGSRVVFEVTLTDEAVAAGYKATVAGIAMVTDDGKTFYTESLPVYASLMNPVYTVNVLGAEDSTVASTGFSIETYLKAMTDAGVNVDVVKAFYAFGKAVIDVRNDIVK